MAENGYDEEGCRQEDPYEDPYEDPMYADDQSPLDIWHLYNKINKPQYNNKTLYINWRYGNHIGLYADDNWITWLKVNEALALEEMGVATNII